TDKLEGSMKGRTEVLSCSGREEAPINARSSRGRGRRSRVGGLRMPTTTGPDTHKVPDVVVTTPTTPGHSRRPKQPGRGRRSSSAPQLSSPRAVLAGGLLSGVGDASSERRSP